jgi:hypothetical protein
MDGKLSRNGTIDLIQEFAELDGTMSVMEHSKVPEHENRISHLTIPQVQC